MGKVIGGFVFAANLFAFALVVSWWRQVPDHTCTLHAAYTLHPSWLAVALLLLHLQGIDQLPSAHSLAQLSSVVAERERGLRRALKTAGMLESGGLLGWLAAWPHVLDTTPLPALLSPCMHAPCLPLICCQCSHPSPLLLPAAFWLSWLAVEVLAAVLFTLLLIAFGAMFQFDFFLNVSERLCEPCLVLFVQPTLALVSGATQQPC